MNNENELSQHCCICGRKKQTQKPKKERKKERKEGRKEAKTFFRQWNSAYCHLLHMCSASWFVFKIENVAGQEKLYSGYKWYHPSALPASQLSISPGSLDTYRIAPAQCQHLNCLYPQGQALNFHCTSEVFSHKL